MPSRFLVTGGDRSGTYGEAPVTGLTNRALRPGERPVCRRSTAARARSAAGGSGGSSHPKWQTANPSRRLVIEWTTEL